MRRYGGCDAGAVLALQAGSASWLRPTVARARRSRTAGAARDWAGDHGATARKAYQPARGRAGRSRTSAAEAVRGHAISRWSSRCCPAECRAQDRIGSGKAARHERRRRSMRMPPSSGVARKARPERRWSRRWWREDRSGPVLPAQDRFRPDYLDRHPEASPIELYRDVVHLALPVAAEQVLSALKTAETVDASAGISRPTRGGRRRSGASGGPASATCSWRRPTGRIRNQPTAGQAKRRGGRRARRACSLNQ